MYDLIIRNGMVLDGAGNPSVRADVAIKDGKIAFVGAIDAEKESLKQLDASGNYVCPGFIDAHSHADVTVFSNPQSHNKAGQGITTDISGMCGTCNAPREQYLISHEEKKAGVAAGSMGYLASFPQTLKKMESMDLGVNMAQYIGHGAIRGAICEGTDQNRELSAKELDRMCGIIAEAMQEGAMGVSFGLIYPPGSYADMRELIECAKVAAKYNGSFSVHMRSESLRLVESVADMIEIARKADCKALISHHKAKGAANWNKTAQTLPLIERANAQGLQVGLDQYPFTASATYLGVYIPQKFQSGGRKKTLELLQNAEMRAQIRAEMQILKQEEESNFLNAGFAGTLISRSPAHPEFEGKTVQEVSDMLHKDPFDTAFDILLDDELDTDGIYFMMNESDIIRIMQNRRAMFGTDGGGVLPETITHPRIVGTFPQVLGKYVRELGVISIEDAVRKMTSLPAGFFNLPSKGLLKAGFDADIVVFDPQRVGCASDYKKTVPNTGLTAVFIDGKQVVENNIFNGTCAGKFIRMR